MVWPGLPALSVKHRDAIVAVAQQLDAQTMIVLNEMFIEGRKRKKEIYDKLNRNLYSDS
jgi:hypothetical protein